MPWLFFGALILAVAAIADRKKPAPTEVKAGERWVLMFSWKGGDVTPSIVQDAFGAALSASAHILSYEFASGPFFAVDLTYTKPARIGVGQTVTVQTPAGSAQLTLQGAVKVVPMVQVQAGERWQVFIAFTPPLGVSGMNKDDLHAQVVSTFATNTPGSVLHSVVFGDSSMRVDVTYGKSSRIAVGGLVKVRMPSGTIATMVVTQALKK